MDNPLRSQYVKSPRGASQQWWDDNAGSITQNAFFDSEPVPPDTGRDAQMFFIM